MIINDKHIVFLLLRTIIGLIPNSIPQMELEISLDSLKTNKSIDRYIDANTYGRQIVLLKKSFNRILKFAKSFLHH